MIHSPAEIIQKLLVDFGLATFPEEGNEWPASCGHLPDTPDTAMAVYDTAGTMHGRAMATGKVFEHFGIAINLRSSDYRLGYSRSHTIAKAFTEDVRLTTVEIGTEHYLIYAISKSSNVISMGMKSPSTRRKVFSMNFLVNVRPFAGV